MSTSNKKLIRLAFIKSEESRIDFLSKTIQNNNNCSLDDYFDKKFKKIIDDWKNNLGNLTSILVKSNKIEHLMYLIYKYPDTKKYVSYYIGYYSNIELYESDLVLNIFDVISGAINNGDLNMIKTILEKTNNPCIDRDTYCRRPLSEAIQPQQPQKEFPDYSPFLKDIVNEFKQENSILNTIASKIGIGGSGYNQSYIPNNSQGFRGRSYF